MGEQEFGHSSMNLGDGCFIDTWGSGPFVLNVEGKSHRFEDSDRFGPSRIKKNGDICENPSWPERSPFWRAHRIWVRQGRRVMDDSVSCVWDEPKPTILQKMGVRNALVVENGDEDGRVIVREFSREAFDAFITKRSQP